MSIGERITAREDSFSDSEKLIVQWLKDNPEQLAFKSAAYVADQCRVSESTAVRFARKLGYENYQELQDAAQRDLSRQLSLRRRLQRSRTAGGSDALLQGVYKAERENLDQTFRMVDPAAFQETVKRLAGAHKVGVFGLRASAGLAQYFTFSLNLVRPRVFMLGQGNPFPAAGLIDFTADDAIVFISVARAARSTIETARHCRDHGIPAVGITDWKYAPLAPYTDPCLLVDASGVLWESYTGVMTVANALVTGVGYELSTEAEERLERLDSLSRDI